MLKTLILASVAVVLGTFPALADLNKHVEYTAYCEYERISIGVWTSHTQSADDLVGLTSGSTPTALSTASSARSSVCRIQMGLAPLARSQAFFLL